MKQTPMQATEQLIQKVARENIDVNIGPVIRGHREKRIDPKLLKDKNFLIDIVKLYYADIAMFPDEKDLTRHVANLLAQSTQRLQESVERMYPGVEYRIVATEWWRMAREFGFEMFVYAILDESPN